MGTMVVFLGWGRGEGIYIGIKMIKRASERITAREEIVKTDASYSEYLLFSLFCACIVVYVYIMYVMHILFFIFLYTIKCRKLC